MLRRSGRCRLFSAAGPIKRVRGDPDSFDYDYESDGFPLGTLTVTSAPRDWHNATIWIQKSSEGDLLFIGPNDTITIADAAGTENGDKRLLASLVDGEDGGKEISLFVRPRFFYEGAAVQSVHYLRARGRRNDGVALDNGQNDRSSGRV